MNTDNKRLEERLNRIEAKLDEISEGIRRHDTHNNFITRLYFILKNPILKLTSYFDSMERNKTFKQLEDGVKIPLPE